MDDPPVDAIELADLLRLKVKWSRLRGGRNEADTIHVHPESRITRIHGLICHEIAHVLLDRYGLSQSEKAANYLGAALLVPRRVLDRQLRAGWDLEALRCSHIYASAELLARRIVDVRSASLAIYDEGRFRYRVGHRDLKPDNEQELAAEALATRTAIRVDDLTGAWPICDATHRRVLVLAA